MKISNLVGKWIFCMIWGMGFIAIMLASAFPYFLFGGILGALISIFITLPLGALFILKTISAKETRQDMKDLGFEFGV